MFAHYCIGINCDAGTYVKSTGALWFSSAFLLCCFTLTLNLHTNLSMLLSGQQGHLSIACFFLFLLSVELLKSIAFPDHSKLLSGETLRSSFWTSWGPNCSISYDTGSHRLSSLSPVVCDNDLRVWLGTPSLLPSKPCTLGSSSARTSCFCNLRISAW